MSRIVLIGTCHDYQIPGSPGSDHFRVFAEDACCKQQVVAIGEEMDEEALAKKGAKQSVCLQLAESMGLAHRYCDLDTEQRTSLYVKQENDIRANGFIQSWEPEKIGLEIRSSHAIREKFWLDRLIELDTWPALFVCGANHVKCFRDLAKQHGFDVTVVAWDWEPSLN